jgi:TusA-related sulfurtransferase
MATTTIDAQGLSCPQPVIMALDAMQKGGGDTLLILVDTETSKENVSRAAVSQGWEVSDVQEEGGAYRIILKKG